MIFCDTSAAVKIYVPERESSSVQLLFNAEDEICLSELTRIELMGVFHRRLREGQWNQSQFLSAVRQFSNDELSGFWTWLPFDQSIIHAAAKIYTTLPRTVFLRSSDCIQVVTALHHNFAQIYTYDSHQSAAAAVLGLKAVCA
ncbi:MAG TPA: type II toxin-antitoxin system VapC family toxin [Candidatus Methylacidiphilales bacterium]|jgi:predicted nucleic acid-binding protein|nr:type II toxin-antitoxin system VapC family toxin [Candidatus Methylacidiphilales bacterium]